MLYITEEYVSNNYNIIDAPLVLNKLRKEVTMVTIEEIMLYGVIVLQIRRTILCSSVWLQCCSET